MDGKQNMVKVYAIHDEKQRKEFADDQQTLKFGRIEYEAVLINEGEIGIVAPDIWGDSRKYEYLVRIGFVTEGA